MKSFYLRSASILFLLLIGFVLLTSSSGFIPTPGYSDLSPGDTAKNDYYLELKGNVRQAKGTVKDEVSSVDSALITIYQNDIPMSEIWTNKKGRCSFKLSLGKIYKIEVSKNGFVTKFFDVNTKVPFDKKDTYSFSFDIDIFEDIKGLDVSVLKKPVAKVSFNLIMEQFAYDVSYTSRINFDLKKMYKNYYLLQKIDADTSIINNTTPAGGSK